MGNPRVWVWLLVVALGCGRGLDSPSASDGGERGADGGFRDAGYEAASEAGRSAQASDADQDVRAPERRELTYDSTRRICDGSDGIRFHYNYRSGGFGTDGSLMLDMNGSWYLVVSGRCEYWAMLAGRKPIRHGFLDAEAEQFLINATHYQAWPSMEGDWTYLESTWISHPGLACLADGAVRLLCSGPCDDPPAPLEVFEATRDVLDALEQLWEAGQSLDDPAVRLVIVLEGAGPPEMRDDVLSPIPWPLVTPLESLHVYVPDGTSNDDVLNGQLLHDPEDVDTLRKIRDDMNAGAYPVWTRRELDHIPVAIDGDDTFYYQLYFRDVHPAEDEQGRLLGPCP